MAAPIDAPGADPDQLPVPGARRGTRCSAGKPRTAAPHRNAVTLLRPAADASAPTSVPGRVTPPGLADAPAGLCVVLRH